MSVPGSRAGSISDAIKSNIFPKKKTSVTTPDPEVAAVGRSNEERQEKMGWCEKCSLFMLHSFYTGFCLFAILIGLAAMVFTAIQLYYAKLVTGTQGTVVAAYILSISEGLGLISLIIAGIVIWLDNKKIITITVGVLGVILLIEAITLGVTEKISPEDEDKELRNIFQFSRRNNQSALDVWNTIENDIQCCGYNGPQDYSIARLQNGENSNFVSPGCCPGYDSRDSPSAQRNKQTLCVNTFNFYKKGCGKQYKSFMEKSKILVLGFEATFIVLQILACLFALPKIFSNN